MAAKAFFGPADLQIRFIDEAGDFGQLGNPPRSNDRTSLVIADQFVDAEIRHENAALEHGKARRNPQQECSRISLPRSAGNRPVVRPDQYWLLDSAWHMMMSCTR